MGVEDKMVGRLDGGTRARMVLSPAMKTAHEKAKGILSDPNYVIQETDFVSVYGKEAVEADIHEIRHLEGVFAHRDTLQDQNAHAIAEVLEAILLEHSELSEWLGSAQTLKTARFDDYKNKTDMVAEWYSHEDGSRILALAVDVTFGTTAVARKFEGIKKEVDTDTLGTLRYFKDTRGDFMGTRNNIPRVVIGVSQETVEELILLWNKSDKKALGKHPVQRIIVEEIYNQLELMHAYAEANGKKRTEDACKQALTIMRPLRAAKLGITLGQFSKDKVRETIDWEAKKLFVK